MKKRLDIYLVENNIIDSRSNSKGIIMSGDIYVNGEKIDKPGYIVSEKDIVEFRGSRPKYVSRGGLKLEKAIQRFGISLNGKNCMDVGASTGGFTDCMLQNGAAKVYSIDVGYGQLAWVLRSNNRVINMERQNIRNLSENDISEKIDFISVDVSFISLKLILPKLKLFIKSTGNIVCLIKPQFEAGQYKVSKSGVVKDKKVHKEVLNNICTFVEDLGWWIYGIDYSPIKGPKGNIEYLLFISLEQSNLIKKILKYEVDNVVEMSHGELNE